MLKFINQPLFVNIVWLIILTCVIVCYVVAPDYYHSKRRFSEENAVKILGECRDKLKQVMVKQLLTTGRKLTIKKDNGKTGQNSHVYILDSKKLYHSALSSLGIYSTPPDEWLHLWKHRQGHAYDSDSQALQQFLMFYRQQKNIPKYWYVYPVEHHEFKWINLDSAFINNDIPFPDELQNYRSAYEMLMLHFDLSPKDQLSWQNAKNGKVSHTNLVTNPVYDNLLITTDSQATLILLKNMKPIGAQIYENKEIAKFAHTTMPFDDLYQSALTRIKKVADVAQDEMGKQKSPKINK